ncbi:hypothetical protein [Mycobacterium avium]|uniref:hypothetical protein n=1 Tax=Mycobacterium avium TaxID=1764 RepID=UPI0015E250F1|nr:hypothetical protein [Mycobacterium avium]
MEQSEERPGLFGPTTIYYSPDPFDYDPICVPCHKIRDREQLTKRLELSFGGQGVY